MAGGKQTLKTILGKAGIGKKDIAQIEDNVKRALEEGESYSDEISKLKNVFTAYNKAGRDLNVLKEQNEQAYTSLNNMRGLGYFRDTKWGRNTTTRISNEPVQVVQKGLNPSSSEGVAKTATAQVENTAKNPSISAPLPEHKPYPIYNKPIKRPIERKTISPKDDELNKLYTHGDTESTVAPNGEIENINQEDQLVNKMFTDTFQARGQEAVSSFASDLKKRQQASGGSYDDIRARLLKEHEGDNGWEHSLGRKKQEFENFNSEMALAYKSGDVEQVARVGRNYGIEIDPKSVDFGNSNYMSAYEEHFIKKLKADPTMWDKAMGNKIPHKVIGTGIGGGAVLALANSRGQRSNAELYGV